MKFEVVWLGLRCACINYSVRFAHVLGGSAVLAPEVYS